MCGIIAAASERNVGKLLVKGLHKMEYRGYDSAGIALHQKDQIAHLRTLGKVKLLEEKMISEKPKSKLGIAHTRWATHGEPSEENAHPHKSNERVYIVHNGIIENYIELKNFLKKEGYNFSSQTDSELIAHMIEYFLGQGNDMLDSMYLTKNKLDGAYAIAAIDKNDDTKIIIARSKSPLLIGIGKYGSLAASDPIAISGLTNKFIFLEDGDVAEISSKEYKIYDESQNEVQRDISQIDISNEATSKGNIAAVQAHLASGTNVNAKDNDGLTPLHLAETMEIAELLIAKGAKLNSVDNFFDFTPLDFMEGEVDQEIIDLLRKHGGKTSSELKTKKK